MSVQKVGIRYALYSFAAEMYSSTESTTNPLIGRPEPARDRISEDDTSSRRVVTIAIPPATLFAGPPTGAPVGGPANNVAGGMAMVTTRRLDVSSSEIRSRAGSGRPIRGFVVDSVEEYISAAKLYRA